MIAVISILMVIVALSAVVIFMAGGDPVYGYLAVAASLAGLATLWPLLRHDVPRRFRFVESARAGRHDEPVEPPHSPDAEPSGEPVPPVNAAFSAGAELTENLVQVIPGRRRFHRSDCVLLDGHEYDELVDVEAREEGLSACSRCMPEVAP